MRRVSLLGILAAANFATAGLGASITGEYGKLSISNFAPVLFVLMAGLYFLVEEKSVKRNLIGLIALFNVCALASFGIFLIRYGWEPNVPVLFFQNVESLFALLLLWYARRNYEEFFSVARFGIICSALISAYFGVRQFYGGQGGIFTKFGFMTFGMDDKSQAAVLFCCQAYILVRFFPGFIARVVAGGLLVMSFLTLSRLPVFFVPVIFLTVARKSRYGIAIASLAACAVVAAFVTAGDTIMQLFKVFNRLSSVGILAGDNATSAHLLLIKAALQMKFTDLAAFFFGTGPGNFSKALTSFPISTNELQSLDPALVDEARLGRAPVHSTPVSMLLDYNLLIVCVLIFLAFRAIRHLLTTRSYLDLLFFASLFGASVFYSVHNKPYLFLSIATVAVAVLGRVRMQTAERSVVLPESDEPIAAS